MSDRLGYFYQFWNQYRYAFNGMEKDDEIKGTGNSYTTFFRQYDPRLGRWFSLDPAMASFPDQSPYAFSFNNPISFSDPDGDCPEGVNCDNAVNPVDNMQIRNNRASNLDIPSRNPGTKNEYTHSGWDLFAPVGTDIKSVYSGKVVDVYNDESNLGDYGKTVMVAHYKQLTEEQIRMAEDPNQAHLVTPEVAFYSFYAHLDNTSVQIGQVVNAGDIIGTAGQTGNASDQAPSQSHLHFEVSTNYWTSFRGQSIPTSRSRFSPNEVLPTKFYKTGTGQTSTSGVTSYDRINGGVIEKRWQYRNGRNLPPNSIINNGTVLD